MHFNRPALIGEIIFNFLISWLTEQSTNGDAKTPIDGHTSTLTGTGRVYFKYHTSKFTYQLIEQSFDRSNGRNRWRYTSILQQKSGRVDWLIYQYRGWWPYWRTQIKGWRRQVVSISNQMNQYSPIDQLINQLIYQRVDKMDGGKHQ